MWKSNNQGYYFCSDPNCSVVYFGQDGSVIKSDALRIKSQSDDDFVCCC
ncbi:hypothetical protein [Vibrio hepatarius]